MALQTASNYSHKQLDLSKYNLKISLTVVTSLFFMWGFITCMNDILIPFVKKVFELSRFDSLLVQFSFFGAYFLGSLLYILISAKIGDPIVKIGYKNGLIAGLLLSALGCALFYPAAEIKVYGLFLGALFILALGFTILQIAANPYVAILGPSESASSRLNLSQAFNSFGTTLAPILGGYFVFHLFAQWGQPLLNQSGIQIVTDTGTTITANGIQVPYLIFTALFIVLAIVIKYTNLPEISSSGTVVKGFEVLKFRHLKLGILAIFMYVGAEVSIGSILINFMHELVKMPETIAKSYLAFYWGGAMIGRFLGAISLGSSYSKIKRYTSMAVTALATYCFICLAVYLESDGSFTLIQSLPFVLLLIVNYLFFIIGKSNPARTLFLFSIIITLLLTASFFLSGMFAIWMIIGIGLFNSIMWSNIFTLAIKDLGTYTSQGSSLLIMAILGGALIPLVVGWVADYMHGYQYSFVIIIVCYCYLAYYGYKGNASHNTNSQN